MKTVFNIICKGRELECTYSTGVQAIAHLDKADNYELSIEPEQWTELDFEFLEAAEKESAEGVDEWDFMDYDIDPTGTYYV